MRKFAYAIVILFLSQYTIHAFDQLGSCDQYELVVNVARNKLEEVKTSVLNGCDPYMIDRRGRSLLHLAALFDSKDTANYLLVMGVSTEIKDDEGNLAQDLAKSNELARIIHVYKKIKGKNDTLAKDNYDSISRQEEPVDKRLP